MLCIANLLLLHAL